MNSTLSPILAFGRNNLISEKLQIYHQTTFIHLFKCIRERASFKVAKGVVCSLLNLETDRPFKQLQRIQRNRSPFTQYYDSLGYTNL